ncbi:MAG: lipopolysaccharide kinase InaA family protein [Planctomycetales bacterium]
MKNQTANRPVVNSWDEGRLLINADYAPLLRQLGLTNYEAVQQLRPAGVAKDFLPERVTIRVELGEGTNRHAFYLKRHAPPPLKEYLKPLIRLRWPIIGARNEWNALLAFHEVHLPTMIPVAYGRQGRHSFLFTASLENCTRLSEMFQHLAEKPTAKHTHLKQTLTKSVAQLARRMHDLGWHHQDFYAGHILVRSPDHQLFIIDLGRVRPLRWFRKMFIFKDLAQLAYSLRQATLSDRIRFLRAYWGKPFRKKERHWLRRIDRKVNSIARHDRKSRASREPA